MNLAFPIYWRYKNLSSQAECIVWNGDNIIATMFIPNLKKDNDKTQSYIALTFENEDWEIKNANKNMFELLFKMHIIHMNKVGGKKPSVIYTSKPFSKKSFLTDDQGVQMILNHTTTELSDIQGNKIATFDTSSEQGTINIFKKEIDLTNFLLFVIYRKFQEAHTIAISRFG